MSRNLSYAYRETTGCLGKLSSNLTDAESSLRMLTDEMEESQEAPKDAQGIITGRTAEDDLATIRLQLAHYSIALKGVLSTRLPGLISDLEEAAGPKAIAEAAKRPQFIR
jgi:hypothetical protein